MILSLIQTLGIIRNDWRDNAKSMLSYDQFIIFNNKRQFTKNWIVTKFIWSYFQPDLWKNMKLQKWNKWTSIIIFTINRRHVLVERQINICRIWTLLDRLNFTRFTWFITQVGQVSVYFTYKFVKWLGLTLANVIFFLVNCLLHKIQNFN